MGSETLIRAWLFVVLEDGSYEAVEFAIRTESPDAAASDVDFPAAPVGFPHAVYSTEAAPSPGATATPANSLPADGGGSDDGGSGGSGADAQSDDVPSGLIPPSSETVFAGDSADSRLVRFNSAGTIADITAFYSSTLGEPSIIGGTPTWFTEGPQGIITVGLTGTDGDVTVDVVLYHE